MKLSRLLSATLVAISFATTASAIVIRHDRDDQRYRKLAERYPAAVNILPDGTGVLIGPTWVLTAAHVARGVSSRSPRVEVGGREYIVERTFIHPDWTEMGPHDIALLKLAVPVQRVTPAIPYDRDDETGQMVTFVGHGDFGTGRTGPTKMDGVRRGATNIVDDVDDDWVFFSFDEPPSGTDLEGVSGPGDSGGPALVERDGTLYTLGVSVFSDGRGQGPGRYGVREGYTRVSTHRDWIASVLDGKAGEGQAPGAPRIHASKEAGGQSRTVVIGGGGGGAEIPDTPFGQAVRKFIEVYNSNDDEAMAAFVAEHYSPSLRARRTGVEQQELYRRLQDELFGTLTLVHVEEAGPQGISILFEAARGDMAKFRFEVDAEHPDQIGGIQIAKVRMG